jgi:hypothetical protein
MSKQAEPRPDEDDPEAPAPPPRRIQYCDRCGHAMSERNCKVLCPNCGNRFDCSDLNLYFD